MYGSLLFVALFCDKQYLSDNIDCSVYHAQFFVIESMNYILWLLPHYIL